MKNSRYILTFGVVCFFMAIQSMAQAVNFQSPNLAFYVKPMNHSLLFLSRKPSLVTVPVRQNHTSFGSFVHYPAFFCQMELKSASRLGVMVKVHAGDYDAYHDKR